MERVGPLKNNLNNKLNITIMEKLYNKVEKLMDKGKYYKAAKYALKKMGVDVEVTHLDYDYHFEGDTQERHRFTITFERGNEYFSIIFGNSIVNGNMEPTLYEVVTCIQKYDVGDFTDFCSNFGYDEDSRKAYATFKAVTKEWEDVSYFFTDEELEILNLIH